MCIKPIIVNAVLVNAVLAAAATWIGMGLVTYYNVLVIILGGIGNGNDIWFCNYNRNHHNSIGIWIRIGNIILF